MRRLVALLSFLLAVAGCQGRRTAAIGSERGPCSQDDTCDGGLVCAGGICAQPEDDGGERGDAGDGGELSDAGDASDAGPSLDGGTDAGQQAPECIVPQFTTEGSEGPFYSVRLLESDDWGRIELPATLPPCLGTSFTIEMWFVWDEHIGDWDTYEGMNPRLISFLPQSGARPRIELLIHRADRVLEAHIDTEGASTTTVVRGTRMMGSGTWNNLAFIVDEDEVVVYLGSLLEMSAPLQAPMVLMPAGPIILGAIADNSIDDSFFGVFNEIRASVGRRYTGDYGGPTETRRGVDAATRGLWSFDGPSTADRSESSGPVTVFGGCWVEDELGAIIDYCSDPM
jgi:hypothetical protein